MNFIYNLHKTMIAQNLMLVYQGDFTQETTKSILTMAERSLEAAEEDAGIKRKVFNVMVESLQNIVKHNEVLSDSALKGRTGIFLIAQNPDRYTIMSGNPVHKDRVARLKQTLNRINGLNKDGLKELYKNIIQDTTLSDKGGAGLGFVDMARKSGEKLGYDFPEMSEAHCLFCLTVSVSRELLNH
jgi:hypothetical protein